MSTHDRAVGALVGLAVGDAVGTTLEFCPPGTFEPITDMNGGGPFGLEAGQWTDDTSMAMCLAESLIDDGDHNPADQLRRYVAWWRHGYWSSIGRCFDIGTTTRTALARYERDGTVVANGVDQASAANGSLMRLAPVPIRWHHDREAAIHLAGESSRTTHPASRPVDACRAMAAMIAAFIEGEPAEAVFDPTFWRYGSLDPRVDAVMRGSWRDKEPPEIRGTGYVVEALEAAIWAVAGALDFRTAVLRAANLGDDADTTAAIAGQLAGARFGVSGIPLEWRRSITEGSRIEAIATRLHDLGAGRSPQDRWGHDEQIHGYWIEPGEILAGEYPGDANSDRAIAKLHLLVDSGIRTFIDLTDDPHLRPYADLLALVADRRDLDLVHSRQPIPDMGTVGLDRYADIVDEITRATRRGGVYFHCWGGIGRTATVAGCLLVRRGLGADEALARIDELRAPTRKAGIAAPQTESQRAAVHNLASFLER